MSVLPIKIENGVASINIVKTLKLKPRQIATIKYMEINGDKFGAQRYLESLMGMIKGKVNIDRLKYYGKDPLVKAKGSILEQFKKLIDPTADHKPTQRNVGQWIGVEIECYIPYERDDEADEIIDDDRFYYRNLRAALKSAKVARCNVKDDGSLEDDDGVGVEVTLLFNSADGFDQLTKLCNVLSDFGCYVNDKCGLHIHLDARHLKREGVLRIGRRLDRALPILKYMVHKSRWDEDSYNTLNVSPFTDDDDERYCAVNLTAYYRFKTVEIRLHGGSVDAKSIQNWIETLQFFANKRMPTVLKTFQDFIDTGIPTRLVEYADKRISALHSSAWKHLTPPTPKDDDGEDESCDIPF